MSQGYRYARIRYSEMECDDRWGCESGYTITSDTVSFAETDVQPDGSKSNVVRVYDLHGASAAERGATA